jgi:tRNA(His) 5'-end guanylyltransferase
MVGQANFSHKELQNKSCNDIQDMLMLQKSINWNDFPTHLKRGSCCIRNHDYDEFGINWGEGWRIDTEIPIFKNEGREYIEKFIYV